MSLSWACCAVFKPMFCPASALWILACSICMDSMTCSKSVCGPLTSMRSPTVKGAVSSTTATLIFEKKCVICPTWTTSSLKHFNPYRTLYHRKSIKNLPINAPKPKKGKGFEFKKAIPEQRQPAYLEPNSNRLQKPIGVGPYWLFSQPKTTLHTLKFNL
jgi:hypothetical protein